MPIEASFPIPLRYIDVTRATRTNLDVVHERRIDDHCNIDGSRDLSDSWTIFTQFTLSEKPPDGYVVRVETDKTASDIQDRKFMARTLERNVKRTLSRGRSRNGQLKNRNSIMQGDYDESISLTLKTWSSRKPLRMQEKLEIALAPAMHCMTCKKSKHGETRGKTNDFKSKFACILEASESTRLRVEEYLLNHHQNHIAGRDTRSKSSSGQRMGEPWKDSGVGPDQSQK